MPETTEGFCLYNWYYKGKQGEIEHGTMFGAQQKVAQLLKVKKSWEVHVVLVRRADGSEVAHVAC